MRGGGELLTWSEFRQPARVGLSVLVCLWIPALGVVEAADAEKILIRNLRLIDRTGQTEDRQVSILIRGSKLDLVTPDEIPLDDGTIGYEAENGVVMGVLDIGKPANFMILDQDPREDIEVLLDTKQHVVFAIRNGKVVRNTLARIARAEPEEVERKPRWIAYEPPPMALPLTYQDTGKWNRWNTKYFSGIFVAAMALDRQRWLTQDAASEQQVGNVKAFDGGEIRAFRVGIAGTFNFKNPWFYQFVVATHAFDQGYDAVTSDDVTWLDYRVDIPLSSKIGLSVGKQKEPISMDRLLLGTQLQMTERAAVLDAMFQVRNVGVTVSSRNREGRISWAAGVFNDWFDESQSFDESSTQFVGRVTGLAWASRDESHLFHLGLGVRYNNATESLRYGARPEFHQSPLFVDTGEFDADETLMYDLEASWRRGPYWVAAELVRNEVDAPELGNPVFGGYHITGSWILTGEMRPYNRHNGTLGPVPVSRTVYQGGKGAWEAAARYSSLDLSDGSMDGGQMDILSLGLNWSVTPTFIVNLNYRHIILDRYGLRGHSDGLMGRVILMLE